MSPSRLPWRSSGVWSGCARRARTHHQLDIVTVVILHDRLAFSGGLRPWLGFFHFFCNVGCVLIVCILVGQNEPSWSWAQNASINTNSTMALVDIIQLFIVSPQNDISTISKPDLGVPQSGRAPSQSRTALAAAA